ncbi:hypothetical protein BGX23_002876, partial [Mortierella sp. AD031]
METALLPSGLSKEFLHVITANHPEVDTRDWQVVTKAVEQVISIHTMRHKVKALHFQPKVERGEQPLTFVTRARHIIR